VPLFSPLITNSDKKAILASLKSTQLSGGPNLEKFESEFSKFTDSKYAIGVSSATSALHLSLLSIGVGSADEIIVPDLTFIATANAVILANAKPICADVDSTLNISPKSIESKITKNTKAIIPVHFAGKPGPMKEVRKIAKKFNLRIIEDCAHAVGAKYYDKQVGTLGDIGCFSFFATKNMTTIEGGMIITNSKKIAKKVSALRSHGITKNVSDRYGSLKPWLYDVPVTGYNYKLDELRSSLGLCQLSRLKEIIVNRRNAAKYYDEKLNKVKGLEIVNHDDNQDHVYHLYIIRIKKEFGIGRDKVHIELKKRGIQTTVHYRPIHQFSYFRKHKLKDHDYPNAMSAYRECLSIPMFTTITQKQQDYVIKKIIELKNIS